MRLRHSSYSRALSVLLSAALVLTSASIPSLSAPSHTIPIQIPSALGMISTYQPGDRGLVVLIQDLHLHAPTQRRILKILNHLYDQKAVAGPVAVEGLSGVYDTSILAKFPAGKLKTKLVHYFMDKGEISGDEAFSILRGDAKALYGVDNASYYTLNRDLYRRTLLNRKALEGRLLKIQEGLSYLKRKHRHEESELAQNIAQADGMVAQLERLMRQEVTLDEVRRIAQQLPSFVEATGKLLNERDSSAQLTESIQSAIDFYVVALMRDKPLAQNTLSLLRSPAIALVVGGFHTAGLTQEFKKAGVGYVVITPFIDSIDEGYHDLYEKRITGHSLTVEEVAQDFRLPSPVQASVQGASLARAMAYRGPIASGSNPEAKSVIQTALEGVRLSRQTPLPQWMPLMAVRLRSLGWKSQMLLGLGVVLLGTVAAYSMGWIGAASATTAGGLQILGASYFLLGVPARQTGGIASPFRTTALPTIDHVLPVQGVRYRDSMRPSHEQVEQFSLVEVQSIAVAAVLHMEKLIRLAAKLTDLMEVSGQKPTTRQELMTHLEQTLRDNKAELDLSDEVIRELLKRASHEKFDSANPYAPVVSAVKKFEDHLAKMVIGRFMHRMLGFMPEGGTVLTAASEGLGQRADDGDLLSGDEAFAGGDLVKEASHLPAGVWVHHLEEFRHVLTAMGLQDYYYMLVDALEGTNAAAGSKEKGLLFPKGVPEDLKARVTQKDISGATAPAAVVRGAQGKVETLNSPDSYAHTIFANVPPSEAAAYEADPLDPDDFEVSLARLMQSWGLENIPENRAKVEVVVIDRPREGVKIRRLAELGYSVTIIPDGTLVPSVLAAMGGQLPAQPGETPKAHMVVLTTSGAPEAMISLAAAKALQSHGAVGSVRRFPSFLNKKGLWLKELGEGRWTSTVGLTPEDLQRYERLSAEVREKARKDETLSTEEAEKLNAELTAQSKFSVVDIAQQEQLNPKTWREIVTRHQLVTLSDVKGTVDVAITFVTENKVFGEPPVRTASGETVEVRTLRVSEMDGLGKVWIRQTLGNAIEIVSGEAFVANLDQSFEMHRAGGVIEYMRNLFAPREQMPTAEPSLSPDRHSAVTQDISGVDASNELVRKVAELSRVPGGIVAGEGLADPFGRKFSPDGRFFTADGEMTEDLQKFMDSLSDKSVQEMVKAGIMYYDIRSGFWREHPEFTVAFAQAFAKKVQEKNGKKDGLVIHIAVDAYRHHFEAAQVFADAILRTGITDNGGGIYYWGVRNGGSIRNYAQLYQATHQNGGDWVFFTQSHRTETDLVGSKLGVNGEVFCGPEIRHVGDVTSGTLFDEIVDVVHGHVPLKHKRPEGVVINVADTFKNDLKVAADMIRATSAQGKEHISDDQLLAGARLYVPVMGRSIAMDVVKILRGLGADVAVDSEEVNANVSPNEVIDPNEHHEHHVMAVKKKIDEFAAAGDPRVAVFVDPDGDRGGLASKDGDKPADDMPGSEVVQLVIENLASSGKPVTAISDMRTGVGAKDLEKALQKEGRQVRVIPYEAGYSFFMRGMSELPADVAIENTLHFFTNPMTNTTWGAPKTMTRPDGKGFQGGDDAGLSSAYLIGAMMHQWEGRTPLEQLRWIQNRYQLAPTVTGERKPALKREDDVQKYHIADRMKQLAREWFGGHADFQVNFNDPQVNVVSGVHLVNNRTGAMVLVRYSNSGPGFTISGEAYKGAEGHERDQLNEMLGLGYLLMDTAIQQLRQEGRQFTFDWKDAADLKGAFDPSQYGVEIMNKTENIGHVKHGAAQLQYPDLLAGAVNQNLDKLQNERVGQKMVAGSEGRWNDAGAFAEIGRDPAPRLGWVQAAKRILTNKLLALTNPHSPLAIVQKILATQPKYVIFAGMGGSSLAIKLLLEVFGQPKDGPHMFYLDTTDPTALRKVQEEIYRLETGVSVAEGHEFTAEQKAVIEKALRGSTQALAITKSATTAETLSHMQFLAGFGVPLWLLTDPQKGTDPKDLPAARRKVLEVLAAEKIAMDPEHIFWIELDGNIHHGGRFSAPATNVYLVAAAMMGLSVERHLQSAEALADLEVVRKDPFFQLAAALDALDKQGKDELTFFLPKELAPFASWVEQLIEESVGKDGNGITIFYDEDLTPEMIASLDKSRRVFLSIGSGKYRSSQGRFLDSLREAGYPVLDLELPESSDVRESVPTLMYGFERMVAAFAHLQGINFVNQPGVQNYKLETKGILKSKPVRLPAATRLPSRFGKWTLNIDELINNGIFTEEEIVGAVGQMKGNIEKAEDVYAALLWLAEDKGILRTGEFALFGTAPSQLMRTLKYARTEMFNRLQQKPGKVGRREQDNHSTEQNKGAGKPGTFSTFLVTEEHPEPIVGTYPDDVIKASAIGTVRSRTKQGRLALLLMADRLDGESLDDLQDFFEAVRGTLRNRPAIPDHMAGRRPPSSLGGASNAIARVITIAAVGLGVAHQAFALGHAANVAADPSVDPSSAVYVIPALAVLLGGMAVLGNGWFAAVRGWIRSAVRSVQAAIARRQEAKAIARQLEDRLSVGKLISEAKVRVMNSKLLLPSMTFLATAAGLHKGGMPATDAGAYAAAAAILTAA